MHAVVFLLCLTNNIDVFLSFDISTVRPVISKVKASRRLLGPWPNE